MAKKKICRICKRFVEEDICPTCKTSSFTDTWKGRLYVADPEHSEIAQKIGHKTKGEYAIKVQ
ncbi:TPA: DNA-directed RNA polymerase subunit E'' [Candidatus Woesearchaeota archaeon]|nr:DNA-directed RNA polymerase subunit E'' [Candidatus Woesearchaeota archaeon]